jgi:hypothetical protein
VALTAKPPAHAENRRLCLVTLTMWRFAKQEKNIVGVVGPAITERSSTVRLCKHTPAHRRAIETVRARGAIQLSEKWM